MPPHADCAESGGVFSRLAAAVALLMYYCLLLLTAALLHADCAPSGGVFSRRAAAVALRASSIVQQGEVSRSGGG